MSLARELVISGLHTTQAQAINGSIAAAVTAAGSNLATATPITTSVTNVATTAVSTGVALPLTSAGGDSFIVHNSGASSLTVYAPSGATINGAASVALASNKGAFIAAITPTLYSAILSA
jgi:hypothetical protein